MLFRLIQRNGCIRNTLRPFTVVRPVMSVWTNTRTLGDMAALLTSLCCTFLPRTGLHTFTSTQITSNPSPRWLSSNILSLPCLTISDDTFENIKLRARHLRFSFITFDYRMSSSRRSKVKENCHERSLTPKDVEFETIRTVLTQSRWEHLAGIISFLKSSRVERARPRINSTADLDRLCRGPKMPKRFKGCTTEQISSSETCTALKTTTQRYRSGNTTGWRD